MRSYKTQLPFPFYPKEYFSHTLITVAVIISVLGFLFPGIVNLFGFHHIPLTGDGMILFIGQLFLYQFLHGDIFHILMNSYFLYQA